MTPAHPWDLIAFDFDGTLADSFPRFVLIHNQLAPRHGFLSIVPEEVESLRRLGSRELMQRLRVPAWRVPLIMFQGRRLFARGEPLQLFPGALEGLQQLHAQRMVLALATSNSARTCQAALGPAWDLFASHRCGISLHGKARRLRQLARAHGIAPGRILYVGDMPGDAEAAGAAGCDFAAVAWGYAPLETLAGHRPRLVLHAPAQIGQLLQLAGPAG